MKTVIIGNSAAAVGCIEGIRRTDRESEIVVISSEKHHTYSRPLISYYLLGKTDTERIKYRPDSFYDDNRVTAMLGFRAEKIDKENKCVILSDGRSVSYDKLVAATGSSPFIPPVNGLDKVKNKFTFMSLDDSLALEKVLTAQSRVLILGAGLIGLKCAEGISGRVGRISVVDLADRILPSILDEDGSQMVQEHIMSKGIDFYLDDGVESVTDGCASLKSGIKIDFDIFVIAVGVRPQTQLIRDIGGEVNRGVVINERCETSIPDIYCAGDCSEGYDMSVGEKRVLALLPNAYMQGECAGRNIAGEDVTITNAIPMNSIGFMGLHIITAGAYTGERTVIRSDGSYKVLFVRDNLLAGYILIGDVARAGIYTSLIRNRTPLDSLDFELIKNNPQLMAFSSEKRAEMLSRGA